jgi:hypothetical protein
MRTAAQRAAVMWRAPEHGIQHARTREEEELWTTLMKRHNHFLLANTIEATMKTCKT